jgi:uracil-DNA glycosylase family 4
MGIHNMMIVGEYPSREDISNQKLLSSKHIWNELEKYGYKRKDFNVSSVIKGELDGKSITKSHINKCSKHLEKEISNINPFVVLAVGNTSLKYFLDQDSGIMEKSGTTEWNDKANAWICWSINPNSIIYSPENEILFKETIKNFVNKIKILG